VGNHGRSGDGETGNRRIQSLGNPLSNHAVTLIHSENAENLHQAAGGSQDAKHGGYHHNHVQQGQTRLKRYKLLAGLHLDHFLQGGFILQR